MPRSRPCPVRPTAGPAPHVEPLEGGLVNRTCRVDNGGAEVFVLRLNCTVRCSVALGVDRGAKIELQTRGAAGLAPRIVGRDR